MNGRRFQHYFLRPAEAPQRRYEALRAVFVDAQPMKDVARRFEVSYGTVRNWVSDFRREFEAGQLPPFSLRPRGGVWGRNLRAMTTIPQFKSPT